MDDANVASWSAFAVNQTYLKKWSTVVYLGFESQSDPSSYWPFQKKAIGVLNQETSYKLSDRWVLALCTSWRKQNIYREEEPYYLDDPSVRNEIRWYSRLFYKQKLGKLDFACSFRPEYRSFYTTDWEPWVSPKQWRFRLKAQVSFPVFEEKKIYGIIANEWLTAIEQEPNMLAELEWQALRFTEDRFTMFLRKQLYEGHVTCHIGLMHQLLHREKDWHYALYLSGDIIINNPFALLKKISTDDSSVGF